MTRVLGASHQVAGYLVTRATSYEVWREDGLDRISALEVAADSGLAASPPVASPAGVPRGGLAASLGPQPA